MSGGAYTSDWLSKWVNAKAHEWTELMEAGDSIGAAETAISAIRAHCSRSLESAPISLKQYHLGVRVVLNALRDVANIRTIISNERWIESPPAVEVAWELAHDASERLVSYSGLDGDFLRYCLGHVNPVLDAVNQRYGPGLYTSWETLWDVMLCSICDKDIRGCEHVPGEWYGEHMCEVCPDGPHPQAVALVTNPRDPRCRLWPWLTRREENGHHVIEGIPIFMIFTPEGTDDGGDIIDAAKLLNGRR